MAKVEWHSGELFPRIGFIVTNLNWHSKSVVWFYNKRGTSEQWIKEGRIALTWTRLFCHAFRDNEVRLQLFALAYNLWTSWSGCFKRAIPDDLAKDWTVAAFAGDGISISPTGSDNNIPEDKSVKNGQKTPKSQGLRLIRCQIERKKEKLWGKVCQNLRYEWKLASSENSFMATTISNRKSLLNDPQKKPS